MARKDFDSIMRHITSGFTGEANTDVKYLKDKMEEYKNHEYGKEIIRVCSRMMFEILPEKTRGELSRAIENDNTGAEATIEEVKFCIYKKDFDKALKLIEPVIKDYDKLIESGFCQDDSVSQYFYFTEAFQDTLYSYRNPSDKDIRRAPINFAEAYVLYGSILIDLKRYEDAEIALKKAIRWNPVNAQIAFEHAETYKARGMMDKYLELTREIFKIAYRPNDLARCYRNMGYYYVEMKQWKKAVCCYEFSLQFEKSNMVQSELYYISSTSGLQIEIPTLEEVKKCFEEERIPFGADHDVMGISYTLGKRYYGNKIKDATIYFLDIFRGFADDEDVEKMYIEANSWD
jgi:tetratricopeptide (TPR) repeat protein